MIIMNYGNYWILNNNIWKYCVVKVNIALTCKQYNDNLWFLRLLYSIENKR